MNDIFEVPQPNVDLLKKADKVRLAAIKILRMLNRAWFVFYFQRRACFTRQALFMH